MSKKSTLHMAPWLKRRPWALASGAPMGLHGARLRGQGGGQEHLETPFDRGSTGLAGHLKRLRSSFTTYRNTLEMLGLLGVKCL